MKKLFLFVAGLVLSLSLRANPADSILVSKATLKMEIFAQLLENLASPAIDMTTKAEIERILQTDFFENQDVRLYQDLNLQFGHAQHIAALQYFNQLRVLYPNGASLKSGDFEVSDIFYNEARDMYYLKFRCSRSFKGLNVMAKKEVKVNKMLDFQVKIMEAGKLKIEIVGNAIAEGAINQPIGLDKTLAELKTKNPGKNLNLKAEEDKIIRHTQFIATLRSKGEAYESMLEEKKTPNKF